MEEHPHYDVAEEPCIPVRTGQHHDALGLRELFLRAHTLEDLALTLPPATSALLRILPAIAARITGLDDPDLTADQWTEHRATLLRTAGGFPPQAVHDYFDRHVFDLFHPTRPFLQDPALARECDNRAGVNKLVFGRPEGNNLAWLSPHTDTDPVPVPSDEAFWHLLIHHYYGASGGCSTRTIDGQKHFRAKAGPLRSTISFHPLGRTLYETLLLGVPTCPGDWPDTEDACPWEADAPPDPRKPPEALTWPGRQLTGRSVHALQLVPTADGRAVRDAYLTLGSLHPALETIDPYVVMQTEPKRKTSKQPVATDNKPKPEYKPRPADADRAVWRDLDALLLAGDEKEHPPVVRPRIFDTLNDLPTDVRAAVRVRACGFDQDPQTKNRIWYTALTPPIWTWSQEHDPDAARRIAACRAAAEEVAEQLKALAGKAWRETTASPRDKSGASARKKPPLWVVQAGAEYWPRAETTFWHLVTADPAAPPRPAFARDAITALRTATAPAIVQFRGTAPAVARAVRALRTEPRPATRRKPPRKDTT